jgi:uncharacterized repeat protein (TIGR01451 family)
VTQTALTAFAPPDPSRVVAGSHYTYRLTVTNHGPGTAAGITLTDTLPATLVGATPAVSFLSATVAAPRTCSHAAGVVTCNLGSLADDAIVQVDITVALLASTDPGTLLTNSATVTAATTDPGAFANTTSTPTQTVETEADLAIAKSTNATPAAGEPFDYLIAVTKVVSEDNARGPSDARDVVVTDTLPAGLTFVSSPSCTAVGQVVTCPLGTFAGVGQLVTLTVMPGADQAGAILTNCASVTSSTPDPTPGVTQACAAAVTPTAEADLQVTQTASPAVAVAGSRLTYTVTVTNAGPSDDPSTVTLVDVLPAEVTLVSTSGGWSCGGTTTLTCTRSGLDAGETATLVIVVDVDPAALGPLTNEASVSSVPDIDATATNDSSQLATPVRRQADLAVRLAGPGTVSAGGTLALSLVVSNSGPSQAPGVEVHLPTPAGLTFDSAGAPCDTTGFTPAPCSLGDLAPGTSVTIPVSYAVPPGYVAPQPIHALAAVRQEGVDPTGFDTIALSATAVGAAAQSDVSVTLDAPPSLAAGSTLRVVATVLNEGPNDAQNVTLSVPTPAGGFVFASASGPCAAGFASPCALGSLGIDEPRRIVVEWTVPGGYTTDPTAVAALITADGDSAPANDSADVDVALGAAAVDLAVELAGSSSVALGGTATFDVTVRNAGPAAATSALLALATPAGLAFTAASEPCTAGFAAPCDLGPIAAGGSRSVTVSYLVPGAYAGADPVTVSASVASATPGAEPEASSPDNADSARFGIGKEAVDLELVKIAAPAISPGQTLGFSYAVINHGDGTATDVSIADPAPTGLTFSAAAIPCATGPHFPCDLGDLGPGSAIAFNAQTAVPVGYTSPDPIVNSATVSASPAANVEPSPDPRGNLDTSSTDLVLASVGDFVWVDLDADGIQDGGAETGVDGVTVRLLSSDGLSVLQTDVTAGGGAYGFDVTPGSYRVEVVAPAGYVFSPADATVDTSDSDVDGTGRTPIVVLAAGTADTSVDAGLVPVATLGDFAWSDDNGNGLQDGGESGLDGIAVELRDAAGSLPAIASTTTAAGGAYGFTNVAPGTYRLFFGTAAGRVRTFEDQGGDDGLDSDPSPTTGLTAQIVVSGTPGAVLDTWDAGYRAANTLGDFVWRDNDGDGVQDAGEAGLAGITVELRRDSDSSVVATTTSDSTGAYQFADIAPGTYRLFFGPAAAPLVRTAADQGGDDELDSDPDATTGITAAFGIGSTPGGSDAKWDAGYDTCPNGICFYSVTVCRIYDTRPLASPLQSTVPRVIPIGGACGIPATAKAVSLNFTVVSPSAGGNVAVYDVPGAITSMVNFAAGQTRANNAVVKLSPAGELTATATLVAPGTVHVVIDVNGYFE